MRVLYCFIDDRNEFQSHTIECPGLTYADFINKCTSVDTLLKPQVATKPIPTQCQHAYNFL